MDFLDDILSSMDKNVKPAIPKPDKVLQKHYQEQQKIAEKERQIINGFKVKIQNKIASFLKNDKVEMMQFDPMEKVFRSIIRETTEESCSNLHVFSFGREQQRYVVVYKNPPTELELEARRYADYTKWDKDAEAEYKKKKDLEQDLEKPSTSESSVSGEPAKEAKSNKKSTKLIHLDCEALGTDLNRNYGMVSTELKKDTRSIEQTLNDIQQKKRLKTQHQSEG